MFIMGLLDLFSPTFNNALIHSIVKYSPLEKVDLFFIKGDYSVNRNPGIAVYVIKNHRGGCKVALNVSSMTGYDTSTVASLLRMGVIGSSTHFRQFCDMFYLDRLFYFHDTLPEFLGVSS